MEWNKNGGGKLKDSGKEKYEYEKKLKVEEDVD